MSGLTIADQDPRKFKELWWETIPTFLRDGISSILEVSERDINGPMNTYLGCIQLMFETVPNIEQEVMISGQRECINIRELAASVETYSASIDFLVDDWADQLKNPGLVIAARNYIETGEIDFSSLDPQDTQNLTVFFHAWNSFSTIIRDTHKLSERLYRKYEPLLIEEWIKVMDSIIYCANLNLGRIATPTYEEALERTSPNMNLVIKQLLDVFYSPDWNDKDIEIALEFSRRAEKITRKGNWIKSWEQEILDDDITSGVVIHALSLGIVTRELIRTFPNQAIQIINSFKLPDSDLSIEKWVYRQIEQDTQDLSQFVEGISESLKNKFITQRYITGLRAVNEYQINAKNEQRRKT